MPLERPPAPASQALLAYALYYPSRRAYRAGSGHHGFTGNLAHARLYVSVEKARENIPYWPGLPEADRPPLIVAVAADLKPLE